MIEFSNVEKIVGQRVALSLPELRVGDGEIVAVVGAADEGRAMLFAIASGQQYPSGGRLLRTAIGSSDPPHLGIVYDDDPLYERLSVQQQLDFFAQTHLQLASRERGELVSATLHRVGLTDLAAQPPPRLMPSAKRRISFALALLLRPDIFVLEEPQRRADIETVQLFTRLIGEEAARGAAILVITSEGIWAQTFATRIYELQDGRVLASYVPGVRKEGGAVQPFKIPARKDERIVLYNPADILYAYSNEGRTILHTATDEAVAGFTLQELEEKLVRSGFFRAHRAYLVNMQHIKEVIPYTRNSFTLVLDDKDGTSIPLSKQAAKDLQDLLGY